MNVKEDITVFLGFKHAAAVETSADDLKRLHQIILDKEAVAKLVKSVAQPLGPFLHALELLRGAVFLKIGGETLQAFGFQGKAPDACLQSGDHVAEERSVFQQMAHVQVFPGEFPVSGESGAQPVHKHAQEGDLSHQASDGETLARVHQLPHDVLPIADDGGIAKRRVEEFLQLQLRVFLEDGLQDLVDVQINKAFRGLLRAGEQGAFLRGEKNTVEHRFLLCCVRIEME